MRSCVTLLGMISGVACPLQARELQGDQACATPQVSLSSSSTRGAVERLAENLLPFSGPQFSHL